MAHNWAIAEEPHPENSNVLRYRWECDCRRNGLWTSHGEAARGGGRHQRRMLPKAPKGPKVLRDLLKLEER